MAQGRCAGCGKAGSVAKIENHTMTCNEFIALYKQDPAKALLPEAEFIRWKAEDRSPEAKATAKERRLHGALVEQDTRRAAQEDRWSTPTDILAD